MKANPVSTDHQRCEDQLPRIIALLLLTLLLLCLPCLLGGCATRGICEKGVVIPAEGRPVTFTEDLAKHDILVQYTERNVRRNLLQPRAYYLFENTNAVAIYAKPNFVTVTPSPDTHAIPVVTKAQLLTSPLPTVGYCVVTGTNQFEIELFRDGQRVGRFPLAVYDAPAYPVARIVAAPVTVGIDTAEAGLLAGCVAALPLSRAHVPNLGEQIHNLYQYDY